MADDKGTTYGAGSKTEREPGVWRLRVWARDETGRAIQRQRTFRGTEKQATKALAGFVTDSNDPITQPDVRTVGDLLDEWVTHRSRGWAPKTLNEARREIKTRIRPRLGDIPLSGLTAKHLDDAYRAWQDEGLSDSTVHRHAAVISSALTQGVKWGWLATSPAAQATAPTQKTSRKLVTPVPDQVRALIRAAEDPENGDPVMAAAVALAFVTGIRRGELCALRWSDMDIDHPDAYQAPAVGALRVERSLTQIGDTLTEKTTKTGRGRTMALDQASVAMLRRHRTWQAALAKKAGSPLVDDPYVLSDNANGGRPVEPSKITDRFTALRGRAKVRGVRFHDLRHAHVTQLLHAGVDATTVAGRVGHASTRMTLDRYAHALPAGDVAASAVIGGMLAE